MIHEFAVDPDSINDWSNFRAVISNFGVENGRLISKFPRRWERMVYEACQSCQDIKLKTIEEELSRIKPKLVSMNREYDNVKNWLQNAENQHSKSPFRAIVTTENADSKEHLLVADRIYNGMGPPWDIPREKPTKRTPEDLADCASLLLRISKEILLVDPHFKPEKKRFTNTFENIIEYAFQYTKPIRIELHIKHIEDYEVSEQNQLSEWHELCLNKLPPHIPEGFNVKIFKWKQKDSGEKFHARYILTERGGIRYDVGLDEGPEGETTDVSLLDRPVYEQRWKDYQKETASFEFVDEFVVQGNKKPNS